ncbi:MAG: 3-oxoacyl-[acyl-carrier-protein] reductase [bacterium]|nr:3-oxoacyl-[acyl-carrier-protein] reductase [bacterium]
MKLAGKVAIVTGAAQGIGKEIATALAQEGSDLAIIDVNLEQAEKTAQELAALGRKTIALKVDVSKSTEVEEMVNKILDKFGKIDILVNNAGITRDNLLLRMKEEEWDLVISINLKGTFNCLKAVTRPMIKARSGKVVNIASIIGIAGNAGQANYAASKAGVIALTKSAAKELASRSVNVNAVAPGFIQTAMTNVLSEAVKEEMLKRIPMAKLGEVKDVAKAVVFLAGPDSDYITGQVIVVDGGMVMNFM